MKRPLVTPPPPPPACMNHCMVVKCMEDKHLGGEWCREHARGAWELNVDLRPYLEEMIAEIPEPKKRAELVEGLAGRTPMAGKKFPAWKRTLHDLAGVWAARLRLGGGWDGKLLTVEGDAYHVVTGMSLKKAEMLIFRKQPRHDLIFCISPWNSPLDARVLAWLPLPGFRAKARRTQHGHAMNWQPVEPWRRVEELL